ncbi:MAG: hypothetical protein BWK75_03795 [Candidatus Altiarchaeales archaeon A3]|nr:MAG: hypothetical protein BWK75_03795 [Candidatus Altiarchaeales archaeon A3]
MEISNKFEKSFGKEKSKLYKILSNAKMNVFVFEYAAALNNINFIAEGRAMLNLMIKGLRKDGIKAETIKNFTGSDLPEKILENLCKSDYTILIAPNYELLKISDFLNQHRDFNKVLISPADALNKTLNKFNLYKELSNKIPLPKTTKFPDFVTEKKELNFPIIIKPIYGAGCESTFVFKDNKSYKAFAKTGRQKFNENFIVQEFVNGIHTSVCLFAGRDVYPVSLNRQLMKFEKTHIENVRCAKYDGSYVPFFNKLRKKVFEYSGIISKHLNLKGYIGMDFVIDTKNEKIYLIEINPRITTSAIALSKATNLNIAKLHIACFKDEEILRKELSEVKFLNTIEILKGKKNVKCRIKKKLVV